jgi:hypothetical protein
MAKRPRDPAQLAKQVFDIAIGEDVDTVSAAKRRRPAAQRAGGLAGSKARVKKLTPEQRSEIARIAAAARWKKKN